MEELHLPPPVSPLTKSSAIPLWSGPGRCRATMSIRWLNWSGLRFLASFVNPALSAWKTPTVSRAKHLVRFRVGELQGIRVDLDPPQLLEKLQRVVDGGQGAQAEEVELDETHPRGRVHPVLRRDLAGGLPV